MNTSTNEFTTNDFKAKHEYLSLSLQEDGYLTFCQKYEMKNPWILSAEVRFRGGSPSHIVFLEQAINIVIQAHDILRTSYHHNESRWERIVAETMAYSLPCHDIKDLDEAEKAEILSNFSKLNQLATFPSYAAPLFQLDLIRVTDDEFILFMNFEHLIVDGLSAEVFLRQLFSTYQSLIERKIIDLRAKPYLDYVLQVHRDFQGFQPIDPSWETLLVSGEPKIKFEETGVIPAALMDRIKKACHQKGVFPMTLLYSVFSYTLRQLTNQPRILTGVYLGNREKAFSNSMGYFINLAILEENSESLEDALVKNQQLLRGALRNHTPLHSFETCTKIPFYFNYIPVLSENLGGAVINTRLRTGRYDQAQKITPQSLVFRIWEQEDKNATLSIFYQEGFLSPDQAKQMIEDYIGHLEKQSS
ncbi:MAG: condensation domain-containing protein [Alphaproteobacteria bacterium]|nr:condensation domain-containing protein [Alphaproteobacteria bacterium]